MLEIKLNADCRLIYRFSDSSLSDWYWLVDKHAVGYYFPIDCRIDWFYTVRNRVRFGELADVMKCWQTLLLYYIPSMTFILLQVSNSTYFKIFIHSKCSRMTRFIQEYRREQCGIIQYKLRHRIVQTKPEKSYRVSNTQNKCCQYIGGPK